MFDSTIPTHSESETTEENERSSRNSTLESEKTSSIIPSVRLLRFIQSLSESDSDALESFRTFFGRISKGQSSTENTVNDRRERVLTNTLTPLFLSTLREEDFEFGHSTESEEMFRSQMRQNKLAARNWLNEIFRKFYHDEVVVIGILRLLSRFPESEIAPQGPTMALAALTHKNDEIKDLGIRAFESWVSEESINVLKNTKTETKWLDDYREQVIRDLEDQLCHS